jgi:predicted alpha/beta hydrolase
LRAHGDEPSRPPVLMVHGATYASRLYDIPYPGASWLRATAEAGFAAYALDIRGYGKSRSAVMGRADTPYAPASAAICDIDDAVAWICARHGVDDGPADRRLLGLNHHGAIHCDDRSVPGGAARRSTRQSLRNGMPAGWTLLADPEDPTRLNPAFGAARLVTEFATRSRWDAEMPTGAD